MLEFTTIGNIFSIGKDASVSTFSQKLIFYGVEMKILYCYTYLNIYDTPYCFFVDDNESYAVYLMSEML